MGYSRKYVNYDYEIEDQVRRFMAEPDHWKDACGSNPKYFVCTKLGKKYGFGLSKFCAFPKTTLSEYIGGKRHITDGYTTHKRISNVTRLQWIPLGKVDAGVRREFLSWFSGFYENAHTKNNISLILL